MLWQAAQVGLHDHVRFLQRYPPYRQMEPEQLDELVRDLQLAYHAAGRDVEIRGGLFIVRRGELDLEGEDYTDGETLGGGVRTGTARTTADTWLYELSGEHAERWLSGGPVQAFLLSALGARLGTPGSEGSAAPGLGVDLADVSVTEVMQGAQLTSPGATVQQAAAQMRDAKVSSLLVALQGGGHGIITDKDLRNRVLAAGLPHDTPVRDVMTAPTISVREDASALSALSLMFRRDIRHLPIVRQDEVIGMVSTGSLLRVQSRGLGHVTQDLLDAASLDELTRHARRIPELAAHLFRSGQRAHAVARLSANAYDALYRRALVLLHKARPAEQSGAGSGRYALVLLGSIARREAALNPDQDHVLLIEREEDRAYFQNLCTRLEGVLEGAGLARCTGGVMCSQHLYTVQQYLELLDQWFRVPAPQAVLNVTIFFDPRVVAGDLDVTTVRERRLSAREHPLFMGHLTRAALGSRPPLGFLRRIRAARDDTLGLKSQGLALIVDLARLHALHVQEPQASTAVRLRHPGPSPIRPETRDDLLSAYHYLMDLRLDVQARQLAQGLPLSNRLSLRDLDGPQEVHLREIFKLIGRVQATLLQESGGP